MVSPSAVRLEMKQNIKQAASEVILEPDLHLRLYICAQGIKTYTQEHYSKKTRQRDFDIYMPEMIFRSTD
jgi:hypothetical protein